MKEKYIREKKDEEGQRNDDERGVENVFWMVHKKENEKLKTDSYQTDP